jgi:Zn-dependent peptidase ImmA (M78 family)
MPEPVISALKAADIDALAEFVAESHCGEGKVDPVLIAGRKGLTVSFNDYGDAFDGLLEHRRGRFHIYCNTARTGPPESGRSRFTVAHELGHWFLDGHRRALSVERAKPHVSARPWESALLCEREADAFAAALLAPEKRFRRHARRMEPGLGGLRGLAESMGLSLTASAIRYAQLEISPCAVVKWSARGACWKHISPVLVRSRLGPMVSRTHVLPADGPTRRALGREDPGDRGFFEAATTAAAWFGGVDESSPRNVLLLEQAIGLGRYGALTFLRPWGPEADRARLLHGRPR